MGPGLISWIGMLSGQYHLSIRLIQSFLLEMCQTTFSTGAISNAQGKLTGSMLEAEDRIQQAVNEVGCLATEQTLQQFDTDGSAIMMGNIK